MNDLLSFFKRVSSLYLVLGLLPLFAILAFIIWLVYLTASKEFLYFMGFMCSIVLVMAWIRFWFQMYHDERTTEKEYERIARNRHP